VRELAGKDLDGDMTVEGRVFGTLDLAHSTLAKLVGDPVVGE